MSEPRRRDSGQITKPGLIDYFESAVRRCSVPRKPGELITSCQLGRDKAPSVVVRWDLGGRKNQEVMDNGVRLSGAGRWPQDPAPTLHPLLLNCRAGEDVRGVDLGD